jgi:hypothetical protein
MVSFLLLVNPLTYIHFQFGGLIGGIAASWLIGPAWKHESTTIDGRRLFIDNAPMYNLLKITRLPKQLK